MTRPSRKVAPIRALLLGFAFIAPLLSLALIGQHLLVTLAPLFVSHLLLLYPTLAANCPWWGPVLRRFATTEREVWITIDDRPSPAHTSEILDILERFDARATFFVIGAQAEKHPHLVTEILARGHSLANHTFTHPSGTFWCASALRIRQEIEACAETLRTTVDRPARLFRAPAGLKNPFVHPVLAERGLTLVGWTVRGLDTMRRSATRVAETVEKQAKPGAIILLHEGHRTKRDPGFHPRCIDLTLQRLAARGYRFVIPRPDQLI